MCYTGADFLIVDFMKFFFRSGTFFLILFGCAVLLGACGFPSAPGSQGSQNSLAQTQQGINVGISIYDPNGLTEQASSQESMTVVVMSPDLSKPLKSPVTLTGKVSGLFFSEGVFPVVLRDSQGREIARTLARADGEWMTEEDVSFTAVLQFTSVSGASARLVFEKDNSSGLPENDFSRSFDVTLQ